MRRALPLISALLFLSAGPAAAIEVWDATTPQGNEAKTLGDDRIREMGVALEAALSHSGVFPGTNPATAPLYQWTLSYGLAAARPTDSVQDGQVYHSTDTGAIELYNGVSWERVVLNFPTGTKMLFFQATCPPGWSGAGVSVDDKFVRAVTTGTTGGTTGGTVAASTSLAHTHTAAHTHGISASGTHTHTGTTGAPSSNTASTTESSSPNTPLSQSGHTHTYTLAAGGDHTHGGTQSASPLTDSQLGLFARTDVVVCGRD